MDTQKIAKVLPSFLLPVARRIYCYFQLCNTIFYTFLEKRKYRPIKNRKNILIYGVSGLSFGGTEKNLQIIAKHLDKTEYNVFFMYGTKERKLGNYDGNAIREREKYVMDGGTVSFIPFDYSHLEETHPYVISDMTPTITSAIKFYDIDLVITAGAGNSEFPLTQIKTPIVFLNIFGIPNLIRKIRYHLCVSHTVGNMISDIVPSEKIRVFYNPSEGPNSSSEDDGRALRKKLGFSDEDIVFGRIGRADDTIFDPIGILAFERMVGKYDNAHYVIVSPPEKLRKIVEERQIKNVHFLDPIYAEEDVWAFHNAIDVLAHFRYDGESCGLNIAESMLSGNPIISHRSRIWNAHLEYLSQDNSFVAGIDDIDAYGNAMEFFMKDETGTARWKMGEAAREKAERLFHIDSYMEQLSPLIEDCLGRIR